MYRDSRNFKRKYSLDVDVVEVLDVVVLVLVVLVVLVVVVVVVVKFIVSTMKGTPTARPRSKHRIKPISIAFFRVKNI